MNLKRFGVAKLAVACVLVLGFSTGKLGAATTLTYTYDALGRLTFVVDSTNGNRDFDYDKLGNRLNVAVGTGSDAASEPSPPPPPSGPNPPTGLSQTLMYDCNWIAQWSAPGSQTSYQFKDTRNPERTVPGGNTSTGVVCDGGNPSSNKAVYIKACNANGCSAPMYFP
jgi:hypothetical protein